MTIFNGAFPVLPGEVDAARSYAKATMGRNARARSHQKRGGTTRETCSLQENPDGTSFDDVEQFEFRGNRIHIDVCFGTV
jgi:hypothetical protein